MDQDAGAIAHQLVGTHGAAVVDVLEDLERLGDDRVGLVSLDVGHEAQAAGVMLLRGVVQAIAAQVIQLFVLVVAEGRRGMRGARAGGHVVLRRHSHTLSVNSSWE